MTNWVPIRTCWPATTRAFIVWDRRLALMRRYTAPSARPPRPNTAAEYITDSRNLMERTKGGILTWPKGTARTIRQG